MKRKIFSKLLMGALLVASVSSFTSCKDYDDDINSLKESVAKAALQSNLDALTSQVATVKSTADQALTTANAAATKAELTAAKSEAMAKAAEGVANAATAQAAADAAKALAQEAKTAAESIDLSPYAKKTDVEAAAAEAMTKIQTALANYWTADKIQEELAKIQAQVDKALTEEDIEELTKKVDNAIEGVKAIWSAVSEISLYYVGGSANDYNLTLAKGRIMKDAPYKYHFTTQKIDDTVNPVVGVNQAGDATFGKNDYANNLANSANQSVSFTDKAYFNFPNSQIVVRVSPTNAVLNAEDIKFIDSQGNDVSSVIKVTDVQPLSGYLTRATSNSGLWRVSISLVDDKLQSDMYKVTQVKVNNQTKNKRYAIALCNTKSASADRYAVSEYNISFKDVSRYVGYYSLNDVKLSTNTDWNSGKAISATSNRSNSGNTVTGKYVDYEWAESAAKSATVQAVAGRATDDNTRFVVANGQTIYVKFDALGATNYAKGDPNINNLVYAGENANTTAVTQGTPQYAYIVRDDQNANLSNDASEINAWKSYQYEGLNTLVDLSKGNPSFKVTIPSGSQSGDEIAFRLFAVNYDGTLVDPDGISFNVYVGQNINELTVNQEFTAYQEQAQRVLAFFDGSKVVSGTAPNAATVTSVDGGTTPENYVNILFKNGSTNYNNAKSITFGYSDGTNFWPNGDGKWSSVNCAAIILGDANSQYIGYANNAKTKVHSNFPNYLCNWADGKTGKFTVALKSADAVPTTDFQIVFNLTKNLPTAADVKKLYSWKEGQLKNGTWNALIYPQTAADKADAYLATYSTLAAPWALDANGDPTSLGYKGLNNGINGLLLDDGSAVKNGNFVFTFEKTGLNTDNDAYSETVSIPTPSVAGNYTAYSTVKAHNPYYDTYILNMQNGKLWTAATLYNLVDSKTAHASTIGYNFKKISSNSSKTVLDVNGASSTQACDYVVVGETFNTVYTCPFSQLAVTVSPYQDGVIIDAAGNKTPAGDQAWNVLDYNSTAIGYGIYNPYGTKVVSGIQQSTIDKCLKVTSPLGAEMVTGTLKNFVTRLTLNADKTKFISNESKTQDYFYVNMTELAKGNIVFKAIAGAQSRTEDTPSTLRIVGKCAFGHEHTLEIPFTVKSLAE